MPTVLTDTLTQGQIVIATTAGGGTPAVPPLTYQGFRTGGGAINPIPGLVYANAAGWTVMSAPNGGDIDLTVDISSDPSLGGIPGQDPWEFCRSVLVFTDANGDEFEVPISKRIDPQFVAMANQPPNAEDVYMTLSFDTPGTVDVLVNDSDPEGDPLEVKSTGPDAPFSPDGTITVGPAPDYLLTFTPTPGFSGSTTITYCIDDGNGGTDTAQVLVTVNPGPNLPPVAVDDTLTAPYETATTVDVLANDSDPDGDPLEVKSTGPDAPTSPNGTVTVGPAPGYILTFTPAAGFSGTTTINYCIDDGNGGTASAQVTVTVTPPITALGADGTSATFPNPPATFDPKNAPVELSVTRQGFDTSANPTTVTDTVTVLGRIREPYPNESTLTADQVALSHFIYAGDTVPGLTNPSARQYPMPQGMWLNTDRERITGNMHTLQLAVAHGEARNGAPVAAVEFSISDGTNTATAMGVMSQTTFNASGLTVPHFEADVDVSGLTPGAEVVIDATIYPWVGNAFTISADAYPYPNVAAPAEIGLSTLRALNDRDGSYGTAYAYVDPAGNDGTGVADATAGTAQASPFATIPAAVAAVQGYNNANFGRNEAGGGVVRLEAGTHTMASFRTAGQSTIMPLLLEAANPANKTTTILTDAGANTQSSLPDWVRIKDITIRKTTGGVICFDTGQEDMSNMLICENVDFDSDGVGGWRAWVYRVGRFIMKECADVNALSFQTGWRFSSEAKVMYTIGCDDCSGNGTYDSIGSNWDTAFRQLDVPGNKPIGRSPFLGWNFISYDGTNPVVHIFGYVIDERGTAVVGNVIESWGTSANATLSLSADGQDDAAQNVVVQHNSVIGERTNILYLDGSVNADKSGYVQRNLFQELNIKSDVFASQATNVGNWPVRYKASFADNSVIDGAQNTNTAAEYDPISWLGELAGFCEVDGVVANFADDASNTGTDDGAGDYALGSGSTVGLIAGTGPSYGVDLYGNAMAAGDYHGAVTQ